ncbi:hypothetical protein DL96DRAFT_1556968 [Flagelloscypha sp. PMI_526]|nr:hypothetical protein DL96DRAFT_1556968 [Flagelloscypha sp. PMI_526]
MSDDYLSATLPPEIWLKIVFYLSTPDLYRLKTLNSSFWRAAWCEKYRQLHLTPKGFPVNRWYEKWPSWTRFFMFQEIFHKYSQPEVNQILTSLTLSANIETLIWEWRRDLLWLRVLPVIFHALFNWNSNPFPGWDVVYSTIPGIPRPLDLLSYWSQYYFPTQIVSFARSLNHVTTLELTSPSDMPMEKAFGTWRYKLPKPHSQPSYFCEVLKCLAPNLLQLSLRSWPRGEGDFTEAILFPQLKKFVWNPHQWTPLPMSGLCTLRDSLRESKDLEELDVAFYLHDANIPAAGVLPIYVDRFLYPHFRKFGMVWQASVTSVTPDFRKFMSLYRDTIQIAILNAFQGHFPLDISPFDEDVLSLFNPSKLLSLQVSIIPAYRYEQLRSALMASTTLRSLSLFLQEPPSCDNPFAFLPSLTSLKLEIETNFMWDASLWALMRALPTSLPALKKLEMRSDWSLGRGLSESNIELGGRLLQMQDPPNASPYSQQPYIEFAASLRAILEMSRWQSWGIEEIDIGFGRYRHSDKFFVHTVMAKSLPQPHSRKVRDNERKISPYYLWRALCTLI